MSGLRDRLSGVHAAPQHRTLGEGAFETIHAAIVTGRFAPGERLPIEDLARSLGLSPMPIREALRRLDSIGLVETIPHRGARVTELSVVDLREVYEARLALEELAVRRAAESFTDKDAARARAALKEHVQASAGRDAHRLWATHTAFHFALYDAAHSQWMTRLITPLWETSERYRFAMLPIRVNVERRQSEHERILEACADHEPGVAAIELHNHLARTANLIAAEMGAEPLFDFLDVPGKDRGHEHTDVTPAGAAVPLNAG